MTTKQEYIDALGQMEELYYNSDNCTLAMNLFKEDINLLTGLVNEHFEERQETNQEHFKDEIIEIINSHLALVNGEPRNCSRINCSYCDFNRHGGCDKKAGEVEEWLNQPHKKPTYKLNQFEYDLINTFDRCKECCLLNEIECLKKLREKGYFNGIDPFTKVHEILDNCEAIK